MKLPLCELSEIPRLLCHHCDSFTLTEDELAYLDGDPDFPMTAVPDANPVRIRGEYEHLVRETDGYTSLPWTQPRDVKVVDGSNACRVPNCTRPAGDAFVCAPCLDDLEVALGDSPALLEDLLVATTKQSRFGASGSSQDRSPLPYAPAAGERLTKLTVALTDAARTIGGRTLYLNGLQASRWLLGNLPAIGRHQNGPDIVTNITRLANQARRTIDRPADRQYIGICGECNTAMHAARDKPEHKCTTCLHTYSVEECLTEIRTRVEDHNLTVGELVQYASSSYNKLAVSRHRINRMVSNGRLVLRGHNVAGDSLYRAGDLLEILRQEIADSA